MATATPPPINIRLPSKYASASASSTKGGPADTFTAPPLEWLHRTWSVTHSTLSMWRTARNVRITYTPLDAVPAKKKDDSSSSSGGRSRIDDLVEYESADGSGGVKSVAGVDTAAAAGDSGAWDWRGRGWLFFVSSHWEVLAWGERPVAGETATERWVVTWFAPTLFTKEGLDVYCDRAEGASQQTVDDILAALKTLDAPPLVDMCARDMRPVQISLPWKER
ncbi:hypothetical protein B0T24DRAFT_338837 [Lasiosphaeria ovina]|uniref:Histidinolphosphatase-like protein n=1 Tax=Lasiosphaeria ovina TaxID=92902 RepID=A0AAE0N5V0_9PEZI|nr:hypothetical protein B0T24DRAFT_338837 [Lasiosphaeria ovina]